MKSYFGHIQNYLLIEGKLKIQVYLGRKRLFKEELINHKGTRIV